MFHTAYQHHYFVSVTNIYLLMKTYIYIYTHTLLGPDQAYQRNNTISSRTSKHVQLFHTLPHQQPHACRTQRGQSPMCQLLEAAHEIYIVYKKIARATY
jgi:hypothetical protein